MAATGDGAAASGAVGPGARSNARGERALACGRAARIRPRERFFVFEGVRYRFLAWEASAAAGAVGDPAASGACDAGAHRRSAAAPVVLVHGFAQRADSWGDVARDVAVRTGRTVYALDLVGHGGSDRPVSVAPYALAAQGRTLAAFARRVGCGGPVPIVGYSMGGRVALSACEADAGAFSAVVLESAGLGPESEADRAAFSKRNREWAARMRAEGVEAFMDWWERLPLFATQQTLPPGARSALRAERLANDAEALARALELAGAHAMPLASEAIAVLRAFAAGGKPVCYLAGAKDAKYAAVAETLRTAFADLPAARVVVVGGTGHNVHLEQPEAFVRKIESTFSAG